ncbi:cysteine sulfinic acid decarboxylase [Turdus rufiventris]|nr:cysteine sulfinic acid decarboxylase [Turdus rufiventris]
MAEPSGIWDSIPLDDPGLDIAAGEEFLQEVFQILLEEGVRKGTDVTQKVCDWKEPQELRELLDLELRNDGEGQERLLQRCRDVLRLSVRTGHPRFFNQLFSGLDHHALAGRFLTETLNTSPSTCKEPLVLMEWKVLWEDFEVLRGKMIPEELEKEIQRVKAEVGRGCTLISPKPPKLPNASPGSEPLFVCATSGTTVLGSFDPLDAIADICARHGLWLHVDGLLQRCHGVGATYLFQRDKFYDVSLDTGDKSPQCGRRADGLKLWILWKAVGTRGLARRVERAFAATRYLLEQVKRREGFQLVMEPEFLNLCFWFIPPSLRGQHSSPEFWDKLGKVAPAIKEKMMRRGSMMVGYQPHGSRVNFFRQIITNPAVTRRDLDFFLDEIQELGWDL